MISHKLLQKNHDELLSHASSLEEKLKRAEEKVFNGVQLRNNMLGEISDLRQQNHHLRQYFKTICSEKNELALKTKQEVQEALREELEEEVKQQLREELIAEVRNQVNNDLLDTPGMVLEEEGKDESGYRINPEQSTELCNQLMEIRKQTIEIMCHGIDSMRSDELDNLREEMLATRDLFIKTYTPKFKVLKPSKANKREDWAEYVEQLSPEIRPAAKEVLENPCKTVMMFEKIHQNHLFRERCLEMSLARATKRNRTYGI